ncbi:SIMPL domain-containing protein [Bartonella sp. CB178]|uniref:SIMPL domain-containing protein n=1 Tax=Bartonella sp. CB178 TaxID=3112255 RepID=UPI00300DC6A3
MTKTVFHPSGNYRIKAAMMVFALLTNSLIARAENVGSTNPTITVTAIGESQAAPDMAIIDLAVVTQHKTAQKALAANNKSMNNIISALKSIGIQENDLQTSSLSIYQSELEKSNTQKKESEKFYHVSNSLTVRVRDLSKAGQIFDQAMALGANSVSGISFINSDAKPFYHEARKRAVSEAIEKAETIAQAAKLKLGKIIKISENHGGNDYPPTPRLMRMATNVNRTDTNFSGGELSYNVGITVTFSVKQAI